MAKKQDAAERLQYLTTAPIPELIRKMSIPTIISMLVTSFYNLVDTAFVGQINTQATAAVGVSFSAMALIQAVSFFFGHGSGNYLSRQLGAGDFEDAERMAATGFFSVVTLGFIVAVTGVVFVRPISVLLGSTPTILPYTIKYLRVIFLGAPFMMGSFVLNNHMRFQGSASVSMFGIVTGAVLNIALDPIMIFGLGLGVEGAAFATAMSQAVSFFLLLGLNLKRAVIRINPGKISLRPYYFKHMFLGGIPSLCRQGIGSIATILLNLAAGRWGAPAADAAIAAMGIVSRIMMFAYSALIGFGQGFQPVCGTNYGAGKFRRVREAFFYCVKLGTLGLCVLAVLGFVFAEPLIYLFRADPDVVRIGTLALRLQAVVFPLNAFVTLTTMLLQTIGQAARASLVTLARQGIFFIPAILILPQIFGLAGVQSAQSAADVASFFLAIPLTGKILNELKTDRPPQEEKI